MTETIEATELDEEKSMKMVEATELEKLRRESIKQRVRIVRLESGRGQTVFGKSILSSQSTIKKAEHQGFLSIDKAMRIAKKYKVSLDYLYGLSDLKNNKYENTDKAFEAIFDAQKDEYIFDAISEKYIFEALRLKCSKDLLEYLSEKKALEKKLQDSEDDEEKRGIADSLCALNTKYADQINKNTEKANYVLIPEDLFEHFFDVIRAEKYDGIEFYKDSCEKSQERLKDKLKCDNKEEYDQQ